MAHTRTRTVARRTHGTPGLVGEEPPIVMGEDDPSRFTRRGVSVRWLLGAVMTGLTSLALMGGALVTALDGRYVVQAEAAPVDLARPVSAGRASKGDRVRRTVEPVSSRRVIDIPIVVREGTRHHIAKRPYALVNASLVLDRDKIGDVPRFDAKELTEPVIVRPDATTDAISDQDVDGAITVQVSALPTEGAVFDEALELGEAEIERQLQRAVGEAPATSAYAPEALPDEGAVVATNLVVVPQNMTELLKVDVPSDERAGSELVEVVQAGDTLSKILVGSGVDRADVNAIDDVLERVGTRSLSVGQVLVMAFALEEEGAAAQRRPERLSLYEDERHVVTVALNDEGAFVIGERPEGPAPEVDEEPAVSSRDGAPSVYQSLYRTALDHELPEDVRDLLIATFANEVDYNGPVRRGDAFSVLHSVSATDAPSEVLYAALTAAGVEKRFYRYKSPDGSVDYFDEDGRTGDRFLLRKPMARGVFRSGFGMRRHPILRRRRMHKGVDYAAPRGTKIFAAGDGVVKEAGWKAGYGRWVAINHRNGYMTGYAHQSRIAKGIKPGVRVKQGQVIGYVGSTGFSTGPHLHYEVHVNGRAVNPLKIRVRRGKELSGEALVEYRSERQRIDELIVEQSVNVAER